MRRSLFLMFLMAYSSGGFAFEPRTQPFRAPSGASKNGPVAAARPAPGGGVELANHAESAGELSGRFLRAVLVSGKASYANVDGQVIRLGEKLDGWVLRKVTPLEVTFVRNQERVVLPLQKPTTGGDTQRAESGGFVASGKPAGTAASQSETNVSAGQGGPVVSLPTASANQQPVPVLTPDLINKLIGSKN